MNRKALLVLIPLLATLSLSVMPALALPTAYPNVEACGFAVAKTSDGCLSGCATLWVWFGTEPEAVSALTDGVTGDYVLLIVQCHALWWTIDMSSIKLKYNTLTFCAYPETLVTIPDPTTIVTTEPLSPITVSINLCSPYCVTALGCTTLFIGQGHTVTAVG